MFADDSDEESESPPSGCNTDKYLHSQWMTGVCERRNNDEGDLDLTFSDGDLQQDARLATNGLKFKTRGVRFWHRVGQIGPE